jgi:hypothetical protein
MSEANPEELFKRIQDVYLPPILERVKLRAAEIAKEKEHQFPLAEDVMQAFQDYIPGRRVSEFKHRWVWLNQNVTGFMAVAGFLTLTFGVLALIASLKGGGAEYFEVMKIFAGALVGGAAGAAASSPKRT